MLYASPLLGPEAFFGTVGKLLFLERNYQSLLGHLLLLIGILYVVRLTPENQDLRILR